jgi:type II secretory pathway pseudopilin PulG
MVRSASNPRPHVLARFPAPRRRRSGRPAFTLLETALALTIVLVGVLAIADAQRAFIRSNSWSSQEATAMYLANEIRELTRRLPRHDPVSGVYLAAGVVKGVGPEADEALLSDYDDVDDFNKLCFGTTAFAGYTSAQGPVDAFGNLIHDIDENGQIRLDGFGNPMPLFGWTQKIDLIKVDPFDLTEDRAWDYTDAFRGVSGFPLRVTVTIYYQGPYDTTGEEVTTVTWIVP